MLFLKLATLIFNPVGNTWTRKFRNLGTYLEKLITLKRRTQLKIVIEGLFLFESGYITNY